MELITNMNSDFKNILRRHTYTLNYRYVLIAKVHGYTTPTHSCSILKWYVSKMTPFRLLKEAHECV